MLAGDGFPLGAEAVLAGEENHSTNIPIYILITRELRDSQFFFFFFQRQVR